MTVCEAGIAAYISSSINSMSASVYTGMDNEDRLPPAITVFCQSANEVVFNSRNYEFDVNITVKEMAADSTLTDYSTLAGNVLAYFTDSMIGSQALSQYCQGNGIGINIYQIRISGYNQETMGDTWINNFNFKFIGALVPV